MNRRIGDKVFLEDVQDLIKDSIFNKCENETSILITGATGLIGAHLVKTFAYYNIEKSKKFRIIALARNIEKAQAMLGSLVQKGNIVFYKHDNLDMINIDENIDYIIHCANPTSSKFFVEQPVETIMLTLEGTKNILEFAKQKNVKKVVYLSSLEVYGVPVENKKNVTEKDYGYLDPMQIRSSYSESKRMAECMCVSYAKEYGVPVSVARLSQTFGPGVAYNDGRVFAEFARCVIEGRDIVLHTTGNTVRSYCYTKDAVKAILYILFCGEVGEAYNVTNMDTKISIKDMAELVCSLSKNSSMKVQFDISEDISKYGYNPEMVICLDNSKLQKLGWQSTVGLKEMYERLILSMGYKSE